MWKLLLVVALVGCAVAPVPREFDRIAFVPESDFAVVWDAVIDVFGERNWPIGSMERESGIIAAEWMLTGDMSESYMDCGQPGFGDTDRGHEARFNVVVREADDGATLTVTATMRASRWDAINGFFQGLVECLSTGVLEREIHELVTRRAST